jgi:transcriptional regulator with PAS, ATPase and Fis domain
MKQMTSEMKQQQINWRRAKVLELSSQGYTEREIAEELQPIAPVTVHRDLVHLRQQAQESLQKHIHETVPEEYQKCMIGMKRNLRQTLEIADTAEDPKVKLQARAIANDFYKYIMDLTTNGVVITDAMKYVTRKQEQIDTLHKLDERIEAVEEETTTTNGVFGLTF